MRLVRDNRLFEDIFDDVSADELTADTEVEIGDTGFVMEFIFKPVVAHRETRWIVPEIPFDEMFRKFIYVAGLVNHISVNGVEFEFKCGNYGKVFNGSENDRMMISSFVTGVFDICDSRAQYPSAHKSAAEMIYRLDFNITGGNISKRIYRKDMTVLMGWFRHVLKLYNHISADIKCKYTLLFESKESSQIKVVQEEFGNYIESGSFSEFCTDVYNAICHSTEDGKNNLDMYEPDELDDERWQTLFNRLSAGKNSGFSIRIQCFDYHAGESKPQEVRIFCYCMEIKQDGVSLKDVADYLYKNTVGKMRKIDLLAITENGTIIDENVYVYIMVINPEDLSEESKKESQFTYSEKALGDYSTLFTSVMFVDKDGCDLSSGVLQDEYTELMSGDDDYDDDY